MYTHLLQYAAVDKTGQCVAVAGKTGLAHYTFSTRKWKLFGNETQVHVTVQGLRQNTPLLMSTDKYNLLIVDCLLGKGFGCVWRDDMVEGFYLCGLLQHYWAKGRGNGHFGILKKVLFIN